MKTLSADPAQILLLTQTPTEIAIAPSQASLVQTGTPVIGQYFDQDLIGSTGKTLTAFYESGQMWALLIGLALGYAFKSITSYG